MAWLCTSTPVAAVDDVEALLGEPWEGTDMIRVVVVDSDNPEQQLAMLDLHVSANSTDGALYEYSALDGTARATAIQALRSSVEILEAAQ